MSFDMSICEIIFQSLVAENGSHCKATALCFYFGVLLLVSGAGVRDTHLTQVGSVGFFRLDHVTHGCSVQELGAVWSSRWMADKSCH